MQPFLELKGVSKVFPGVRALDNINLEILPGEVHGLVGENGAGKSTLIKILTGAYKNDAGKIYIEGKEAQINGPRDAMKYGITAIYQELNTIKGLSVAENVFLGREIKQNGDRGLLNIKEMRKKSHELLKGLGQDIDTKQDVALLGIGQQQMVEIAKALSIKTKLLIMDEPTSSLTGREVKELLRTVRELKSRGIAVIYISHRLEEVMEICDRVTVMRDGMKITTLPIEKVTVDELIKLMVGRNLEQQFPKIKVEIGEEALRVENLTRKGTFENISFNVKKGEIIGIAGLVGAGRTEVARAIFGADEIDSGEIYIENKKVNIKSPKDAMNLGIAFLTEDRKGQGLVLDNTIDFNVHIASYKKSSNGLLLNLKKLKETTRENIKKLNINPPIENFVARQLSGGNQQKVVIAKWLNTNARIFIVDEPTRGIDVGAKVEVYNILNNLIKDGAAVIMISSELPEILGMSDRVYVMHEGRITAEIDRAHATQENIMLAATGGN
ncbi:monosaccharide ABC transporter ATP-binding protein, CUT2 family [Caloramator quimbayensis]|uniref:Monosaccharide ABC transporter ATP-binding protein, CUT2 family n=1 Tax=Caloramator quimbayensis TaxID=1147123 RepID=A0A1T4WEP3_9CLOT|nr:sugar ABC transporter ATP-binding protein [Caloramator quimbayensis]SKA75375.1 monosaccharide ABC transporter ATP-binding protein, CUT2 family [Caloramator quimbayensis]